MDELLVLDGLDNGATASLVKSIKHGHVLLADVEIKYISVSRNPVWIVGFRKWNPFLLQRVAYQDLLGRLVVFLCQVHEGRVVCFIVPHNGGIRLDNDSVLLAVCIDHALLAPRVKLCDSKSQPDSLSCCTVRTKLNKGVGN